MERYENDPELQGFLELVRTYSASRDERKIADILLARLKELGCTDVYEDGAGERIGGNCGNIYGVLPGSLPGALLFCSHMDRGEIISGRPIRPEVRGGRIYSDGTTILAADDVAGITAILGGLRRIAASGRPHCRVEVLFTVCEEDCAQGSRFADYSRLQAKIGYAMDSNGPVGRIVNAAPSGAKIALRLYGRGAHYGSAPENGIDASKAAARVLLALPQGRIDPDTVSNFPVLHAGSQATYGICEYAEILGQAQSHVPEKLEAYLEEVKRICEQETAGSGIRTEMDAETLYDAWSTGPDTPCMKLVTRALSQMGVTSFSERGNACLDSHHFNAHGIQSVALGMGYLRNHSNQEYQEIGEMFKNMELVERLVMTYSDETAEYAV